MLYKIFTFHNVMKVMMVKLVCKGIVNTIIFSANKRLAPYKGGFKLFKGGYINLINIYFQQGQILFLRGE